MSSVTFMSGQGWSFTPTIHSTCPYTSSYVIQANIALSSIGNMGLPTKSQCESIRQAVLGIKYLNVPAENGGTCSVYYTCTECIGSDVINSTTDFTSFGSVSINGLTLGSAFFSPHPSFEFEDWYSNNMQKLKSMGINLDSYFSGNGMATDNRNFNNYYADQISKFEKSIDPSRVINYEKPEQGGVVDLRSASAFEGKVIDINNLKSDETKISSENTVAVVPLKKSQNEVIDQATFEITQRWNMSQMTNSTIEDLELKTSEGNDSYKFDLLMYVVGKIPGGALPVEIGSWIKSIGDASLENLNNAVSYLSGSNTSVPVYDVNGVLVKGSINYIGDKAKDLGVGFLVTPSISSDALDAGGDVNFAIKTIQQVKKWKGN